jgi:hypothetical protein
MDLSVKATGTLVANAALAAKEVPAFAAMVREAIAAVPAAALQQANTVTVSPGGATFSTIQAALDSITDAKLQKQYVVQIGPGTYKEVVTCKPYVYLQGAGIGQTIVTASASAQQYDKGTIKGASNSAVQNMTVISTGTTWGCWAAAIDCNAAVNFDIENCSLEADNGAAPAGGSNLVTVSIDYSAMGGGSQVNIAYCTILANGGAQPEGLITFANGFVEITDTKILSENAGTTWGAASNGNSTLNLYNCVVSGTMSLVIPDYVSKITATDCTLDGPYSPGVVVINNAP